MPLTEAQRAGYEATIRTCLDITMDTGPGQPRPTDPLRAMDPGLRRLHDHAVAQLAADDRERQERQEQRQAKRAAAGGTWSE